MDLYIVKCVTLAYYNDNENKISPEASNVIDQVVLWFRSALATVCDTLSINSPITARHLHNPHIPREAVYVCIKMLFGDPSSTKVVS